MGTLAGKTNALQNRDRSRSPNDTMNACAKTRLYRQSAFHKECRNTGTAPYKLRTVEQAQFHWADDHHRYTSGGTKPCSHVQRPIRVTTSSTGRAAAFGNNTVTITLKQIQHPG